MAQECEIRYIPKPIKHTKLVISLSFARGSDWDQLLYVIMNYQQAFFVVMIGGCGSVVMMGGCGSVVMMGVCGSVVMMGVCGSVVMIGGCDCVTSSPF